MAIRGAITAERLYEHGKPWISETPKRRPNAACVHKSPEWEEAHAKDGVHPTHSVQCEHGPRITKPTEWMWYLTDLSDFPTRCKHPRQRWAIPWNRKMFVQPHPPLRGKQYAVLEKDWHAGVLRDREPHGPYMTKGQAAYPTRLNLMLAYKLVHAIKLERLKRSQNGSMIVTDIRAGLLLGWANAAGDKGASVAQWCYDRALAGILKHFDLENVSSPSFEDEVLEDSHTLETDFTEFVKYEGFEDDNDAVEEIMSFHTKGSLKRSEDLERCKRYLGRPLVLSRFGCIKQMSNGRTKRRMVLDLKRAKVTKCT